MSSIADLAAWIGRPGERAASGGQQALAETSQPVLPGERAAQGLQDALGDALAEVAVDAVGDALDGAASAAGDALGGVFEALGEMISGLF